MEELLVKNLNYSYPGANQPSLKDLNFKVERGAFFLLTGLSGSGKTSLLKQIHPSLSSTKAEGEIYWRGKEISRYGPRQIAQGMSYVPQNPKEGIVTDKVWHELSFTLENLGIESKEIRLRVGEIASYFSMEDWMEADTSQLSGGQEQLLNLASALVTHPSLLLLDEPRSQLDPIQASRFLEHLARINRDFGISIIIADHRMDELLEYCDRMLVLDHGSISYLGEPRQVALDLMKKKDPMGLALPQASLFDFELARRSKEKGTFRDLGQNLSLSVKEAKDHFKDFLDQNPILVKGQAETFKDTLGPLDSERRKKGEDSDYLTQNPLAGNSLLPVPRIRVENLYFRYDKEGPDVLEDCSLDLELGKIHGLLGGNGSGKTSLLKILMAILPLQEGKIRLIKEKASGIFRKKEERKAYEAMSKSYMPQDPTLLFAYDSLEEELKSLGIDNPQAYLDFYHFDKDLEANPFELSGGEKQIFALLKLLAKDADLIFLDEPSKGLDIGWKKVLGDILGQLKDQGKTIILVSHDTELLAKLCDQCHFLFQGKILLSASTQDFFASTLFYSTQIHQILGPIFPQAIRLDQALDRIDQALGREK